LTNPITDEELFSYYTKLAKEKIENKDYHSAISYLDKAINKNNSKSFCFNDRAVCKTGLDDYSGAIEDYSTAIELDQGKSSYFVNRGMTYWIWGKQDEAYKDWKKASSLGSESAKANLNNYFNNNYTINNNTSNDFLDLLNQKDITCFYHFTDKANIQSITTHGGLYSWFECGRRGINIPVQGGSDLSIKLDSRHNLQDYVRLSFNKRHPMLYIAKRDGRIKNHVFLEISPKVILLEGTQFSDENATANSAIIGSDIRSLNNIDFKLAKSGRWQDETEKRCIQAEVLIKTHIPLKYITNI